MKQDTLEKCQVPGKQEHPERNWGNGPWTGPSGIHFQFCCEHLCDLAGSSCSPSCWLFIVVVFACGTCTHSCGYVYMTVGVHMYMYVVHVEVKGQCQLPS